MLASPAGPRSAPWLAESRQLWSVPEMIEFYGEQFVGSWMGLHDRLKRVAEMAANETTALVPVTPVDRAFLSFNLKAITSECERLEMNSAIVAGDILSEQLADQGSVSSYAALYPALEAFLRQVDYNFANARFAFIPGECWPYFESGNLFDLTKPSPLPSTENDIRNAGNALAVGLYAAAAFYLLRVAELGMRELFVAKNVVVPKRPNLEDAGWGELIEALDTWLTTEIQRAGTPARGSRERKEIDSYRALISDVRFLKEERDKTMHCRHEWAQHEVEHLLGRLRKFTQQIAVMV